MKIAIVSSDDDRATDFVDTVLFPALLEARRDGRDFGFEIYERLTLTVRVAGQHTIHVATFTTPAAAALWLDQP